MLFVIFCQYIYQYINSYDNKADLWSAGTVLFEMISGRPPFHGENPIDLLRNIQQKAVRLPPDLRVSKECVKLLRILLNRNPLSRAGFREFIEASNAFVALGCNGVTTSLATAAVGDVVGGVVGNVDTQSQQFANLGPISEEETHHNHVTTTMTMTQDRNEDQQRQQRQQQQQKQQQQIQTYGNHNNSINNNTNNKPVALISESSSSSRVVQQFSPLEPSPPGPKPMYPQHLIPPMLSVGGSNHEYQQQQQQQQQYTNNSFHHHQQQQQQQRIGKSESSQNSDDSEFVMVERGASQSATSPTSSSSARLEDRSRARSPISGMWKQSSNRLVSHKASLTTTSATTTTTTTTTTGMNIAPSSPVSPRSNSSRFFSGKTILSSRNLIPPSLPFVNKGIGLLSTSPGTGGALVDLMGNNTSQNKDNKLTSGVHNSRNSGGSNNGSRSNSSSLIMPQNGVFNYELFARMLSAAEDVGRRAINVAHVGDTRAYLAMRMMISNEELSSSSGMPMEGVVEECNGDDDDKEDEESSVFFNHMTNDDDNTLPKRGRAVSTDQSVDEDDEMPFAIPSAEDKPHRRLSSYSNSKGKQYSSTTTVISDANCSHDAQTRTSAEVIQMRFREAMLCYIKSLSMLKGSVNASQRILTELNSIGKLSAPDEIESMNQFKRRCETSHKWLTGQFKGVVERAEAAKAEISKLSASSSSHAHDKSASEVDDNVAVSERKTATVMMNVEELIYNHSLTCGKDGAVKQLLGQYEAARACYRSAGLLIETLLMEPKLVDDDKKTLESYVQGFAERINELDHIMLYQTGQRHSGMITSSSCLSIVPIVGGPFGQQASSTRHMMS